MADIIAACCAPLFALQIYLNTGATAQNGQPQAFKEPLGKLNFTFWLAYTRALALPQPRVDRLYGSRLRGACLVSRARYRRFF